MSHRSFRLVLVVGALGMAVVAGTLALVRPVADQSAARPVPEAESRVLDQMRAAAGVSFEENRGQAPGSVQYLARGDDGSLALTDTGAIFETPEGVLEMRLPGADLSHARGEDGLPGTINYLIGNDPSQWTHEVPTFGAVRYEQAYPGIDVLFRRAGSRAEYDFVVAPGADPSQIALTFPGASVRIDEAGNLVASTGTTEVVHHAPVLYQRAGGDRQEVGGAFRLDGDTVRFEVGGYDPTRPLVIDPLVDLLYGTLLGGSNEDVARAIAVDPAGNAYIAGRTGDAPTDFPVTTGAFDTTQNGERDAFVAKLGPRGNLVWATFLGGADSDSALGIAVDAAGSAYVVGNTDNDPTTDFPTTAGAFDTTHNGNRDAFVAKLNPAGSALVYSTFLGGDDDDSAADVSIDGSGNAYVTGNTYEGSALFPTTAGAFDTTHNGYYDAFLTKLNPAGNALVYSTFLGGDDYDFGAGVATDGGGNAYVSGETYDGSTDYPTTAGAFDTTHNGSDDAFVSKVNPAGSALVFSTFVGGDGGDYAEAIAIDAGGNSFITGYTYGGAPPYPTTPGALDTTLEGPPGDTPLDAFVTKLNAAGSSLVYSTYLGKNGYDYGQDIAVDGSGSAYVAGYTGDEGGGATPNTFPTTAGALQASEPGGGDGFLTQLNPSGGGPTYSTFLGGRDYDEAEAVAVDAAGNAYVAGYANDSSRPIPTTGGSGHVGGDDAFVLKLGEAPICKGKKATIFGTEGNDVLLGTKGNDVIAGLGGNDKMKGNAGNDLMCGGAGKDNMRGGAGKDKLVGQAGKDTMKGGGGKDKCVGGPGKDKAVCEKEKKI